MDGFLFHNQQIERIEQLLLKKGYKKEMFFREFTGNSNYTYDFCVIEPDTQKTLLIFEFKMIKYDNLGRMKSQIGQICGQPEVDSNTMIFFSILSDNNQGDYIVNKEKHRLIEIKLDKIIPTYQELEIKREISYKNEIEDGKNRIVKSANKLKNASLMLSFCLIIFLVLDIFGVVEITTNRLILIGIIVSTLIIPYFNTVKIGDMFELKQK